MIIIKHITQSTDDHRESAFQRLSVLIQRYNTVAVLAFAHKTPEDKM